MFVSEFFRYDVSHNRLELSTRRTGLFQGAANSIDYIITLTGGAKLQFAVGKVNVTQDVCAACGGLIVSRC